MKVIYRIGYKPRLWVGRVSESLYQVHCSNMYDTHSMIPLVRLLHTSFNAMVD